MHYNFMTNESLQRIYFKFCTNKFLKSWLFFEKIFVQLYLLTAVPVFALPQITEPSHPVMAVGTNHLFDFWKIITVLYL